MKKVADDKTTGILESNRYFETHSAIHNSSVDSTEIDKKTPVTFDSRPLSAI